MDEKEILEEAVMVLRAKMPPRWKVEVQRDAEPEDAFLSFSNQSGSGNGAILEVRRALSPRDALALLDGLGPRLRRRGGDTPIVVAAPYISPRSRDLLTEQQIGYVDLTGNIRIAIDYPGVFIESQGAQKDPGVRARPHRGLRGAMVGKIVRVLIDTKPPYGVMDVAKASKISPGYTSRVFDVLDSEALIERDRRGPITEVRWPELIRRRAEALELFERGSSYTFISTVGAQGALRKLSETTIGPRWAVTGSFAATRLVQVAAPTLLAIYSMEPRVMAEKLDLRPADQGADVILIRPKNPGVFLGVIPNEDGINWVAPSQVAIDCLSGTGRMPAEGEAVVQWMTSNESDWRVDSIAELIERWSSFRWD